MRELPKHPLASRLKLCVKFICVFVFLIGFIALIGWEFNIGYFKSLLPDLPVMAPNTGLTLILSSLALWLLQDDALPKTRRFGFSIAIFIAIVGIITLIEYILGISLGIDNLFFKNAVNETGLPIRMSPQSAVNFIIIGISLFLIDKKTKTNKYPSQFLILVTGLIALLTLFGFVHDLPGFYTISPYKGMAAQTAISFIFLFFGIFISRSEQGLMKVFSANSISGFVSRRLFISLLFLSFADIFVMAGQMNGFWTLATESIMHVLLITIVFIYLMFIGFNSLDRMQTLEDVDLAKTEFVSFASHQFREPLTAIRWHLSAVLDESHPPTQDEQRHCFENIQKINGKMIDLVNAFLDVSKIELGSYASEIKIVDAKKIVESVISELQPQVITQKIELSQSFEKNLPMIEADPKIIKIIFQNLLSNAVKYTPDNGKITLSLKSSGDNLEFSVSDTGFGIPDNQKNKVFSKLFRASNIKTIDTKGSGLGLYLVKLLLNQMMGKIWFESEENKGTIFYVLIPKNHS